MPPPFKTASPSDYIGVFNANGNLAALTNAQDIANLATGGGGGAIVAGLGLYGITNSGTITVGNTGTIIMPGQTDTGTTAPFHGAYMRLYATGVSLTNVAGAGNGGSGRLIGGNVTYGGVYGYGASGYFNGGTIDTSAVVKGGSGNFQGGQAEGSLGQNIGGGFTITAGDGSGVSAANTGGDIVLTAGSALSGATNTAGNFVIAPGTGDSNGLLLVNNIGTVDPHVLNAKFQVSVSGVGYVGVYSKG